MCLAHGNIQEYLTDNLKTTYLMKLEENAWRVIDQGSFVYKISSDASLIIYTENNVEVTELKISYDMGKSFENV